MNILDALTNRAVFLMKALWPQAILLIAAACILPLTEPPTSAAGAGTSARSTAKAVTPAKTPERSTSERVIELCRSVVEHRLTWCIAAITAAWIAAWYLTDLQLTLRENLCVVASAKRCSLLVWSGLVVFAALATAAALAIATRQKMTHLQLVELIGGVDIAALLMVLYRREAFVLYRQTVAEQRPHRLQRQVDRQRQQHLRQKRRRARRHLCDFYGAHEEWVSHEISRRMFKELLVEELGEHVSEQELPIAEQGLKDRLLEIVHRCRSQVTGQRSERDRLRDELNRVQNTITAVERESKQLRESGVDSRLVDARLKKLQTEKAALVQSLQLQQQHAAAGFVARSA